MVTRTNLGRFPGRFLEHNQYRVRRFRPVMYRRHRNTVKEATPPRPSSGPAVCRARIVHRGHVRRSESRSIQAESLQHPAMRFPRPHLRSPPELRNSTDRMNGRGGSPNALSIWYSGYSAPNRELCRQTTHAATERPRSVAAVAISPNGLSRLPTVLLGGSIGVSENLSAVGRK